MYELSADKDAVHTWLDSIKEGWAARFAAAFASVGVEDTSDLADMTDEESEALMNGLSALGAKPLQLRKIQEAITASTEEAVSTRTRLQAASGRRSAASQPNLLSSRSSSSRSSVGSFSRSSSFAEPLAEQLVQMTAGKTFTAFLSHHKHACAMEARFIKEELERMAPGSKFFLDSDDLKDMRALLEFVRDSACLVLVQSEHVLQRPWCLLELYAAIDAGVPIVALNVAGKGYSFADAAAYLPHLDKLLEAANPGAGKLVEHEAVRAQRQRTPLRTHLAARAFEQPASRAH